MSDTASLPLLDSAEVAQRLGVKPRTVLAYSYRGKFPEPDGHVGRTPVWRVETVDDWLRQHSRPGVAL